MNPDKPLRDGRRFKNPWPGIEQHGFADVLRWTFERRGKTSVSRREVQQLASVPSNVVAPRVDPDTLTATWVGHTTVLLQLGGLNILTDPVWSQRASPLSFAGPKRFSAPGIAFDELPIIDAVIISHDHYDHLDSATVSRLTARFPAAAWRVPVGVGSFVRARGANDVEELTWNESSEFEGVRFTCVPAQHFSGRSLFNRDQTLWCGWVITANGRSVYFAGDTAMNPSFADIGRRYGPFELALMPIGAYDPRWFMRSVHMDPEECVRAATMLGTGAALPHVLATHWGTFKLTDEPLDEPPQRMKKAWAAAGLPPDKLLILAFGETRAL
jgi:N-acyl-phosphatidylethanolamine-hydrolysing phospholipase D